MLGPRLTENSVLCSKRQVSMLLKGSCIHQDKVVWTFSTCVEVEANKLWVFYQTMIMIGICCSDIVVKAFLVK